MMLTRSETIARAEVTDRELRDLEQQGLVVPSRNWRTLWLVPRYHRSQIDVIQWLVSCQRTVEGFREQERRLLPSGR